MRPLLTGADPILINDPGWALARRPWDFLWNPEGILSGGSRLTKVWGAMMVLSELYCEGAFSERDGVGLRTQSVRSLIRPVHGASGYLL